MQATRLVAGCLLAVGVSGATALAQPVPPRLFTAGAAIAVSCPAAYTDIPIPEADCSDRLEGAPGPYLRPYLTVRAADRLIVTTTVGTLRMPALRREVYNDGRTPPVVLVAADRTAWHVHTTAAYVGGAPVHPVRALVGAGIVYFHDPIRQTLSGSAPEWVDDTLDRRRTGLAGVFVAGILIRVAARVEGRATYTLAPRLATPTTGRGSWRHEFAFGLGWTFGRQHGRVSPSVEDSRARGGHASPAGLPSLPSQLHADPERRREMGTRAVAGRARRRAAAMADHQAADIQE